MITEKGSIINSSKFFDLNVFKDDILLSYDGVQIQNPVKIVGKVAELQAICNRLIGTNLQIDNIYGSKTDSAIKKLPLCSKKSYNKELTIWIQLRLGCNPDGIFGNDTETMVKMWQRIYHLNVDGIVGYYTLRSLCLNN